MAAAFFPHPETYPRGQINIFDQLSLLSMERRDVSMMMMMIIIIIMARGVGGTASALLSCRVVRLCSLLVLPLLLTTTLTFASPLPTS